MLLLPALLANIVSTGTGLQTLRQQLRPRTATTGSTSSFYGLLIVGFAYFYNAIAFDPVKQADQIRKQGGFIPGIRPGPQTERYLSRILNRITLPGAVFIAIIALLPSHRAGRRQRARSSRSAAPPCSSPSAWPSRR